MTTTAQVTAKTDAAAAVAAAVALKDTLLDEGSDWTAERVERRIMDARADLDTAVDELRAAYGVDAFDAVDALLELAEQLLDLGIEINSGKARVVEWTAPQSCSSALAAWWLYGDVDRRDEIEDLNHLRDPNRIAMGQVLKVLAA